MIDTPNCRVSLDDVAEEFLFSKLTYLEGGTCPAQRCLCMIEPDALLAVDHASLAQRVLIEVVASRRWQILSPPSEKIAKRASYKWTCLFADLLTMIKLLGDVSKTCPQ